MHGNFRADPRTKLLFFFLLDLFAVRSTALLPNLLFAGTIFFLLYLEEQKSYALRSGIFFLLILLLETYVRVLNPDTFGLLVLSFTVLIRMLLLIMMGFNYVGRTTDVSEFMAAMQKLHLPMGLIIPIATLFRFVPTVLETYAGVTQAMSFRGIRLTVFNTLKHPIQTLEHLLVPLLFSAMSVMDELSAAAMTRGLDSKKKRTSLVKVNMHIGDWVLLCWSLFLYMTSVLV